MSRRPLTGGLGSDATIETADVIIQNDEPAKVAIAIGRVTRRIVWQNITLSLAVKGIVLVLDAGVSRPCGKRFSPTRT